MVAADKTNDDKKARTDFDRFLLLLGRLNYSWTNTESLLIHLIAGLSKTDKKTSVVIFLTLNTTRARTDLVERLSKLERVSQEEREAVLAITQRIKMLSGLRNRYNHCIYSFDSKSGDISTIRMRVADRKNQIKVGEMTALDASTIDGIDQSLDDLKALNSDVWVLIQKYGYPA
ncbi:hypothetical protein [Aliiroseovarius sp. F47248L]|uniref:hypothetical protein n=1 Tax=Aliiroseovarius sp. F47248L TaxID=2926420 RepID=UPI001FF16A5E|nr:hypothetical protein [Aliiroseovarius sp. F47248L]MCK0139378.1 hypothetical protein [Aliiroseovarius sp. F47248L]